MRPGSMLLLGFRASCLPACGDASPGGNGSSGETSGTGGSSGSGGGSSAGGSGAAAGSSSGTASTGSTAGGTEYACIQGNGFFDGPNTQASITAMLGWKINAFRIP